MNQAAFAVSQVMPLAVATGLFISRCTIQAPDGNLSASGQPSGTYANVSGLVNIQCMDAPEAGSNLAATEKRSLPQIESLGLRHVLLDSYYSQLSPATNWGNVGWRAIVDGVTYDLKGAENDSQFTQTRLCLQAVTT